MEWAACVQEETHISQKYYYWSGNVPTSWETPWKHMDPPPGFELGSLFMQAQLISIPQRYSVRNCNCRITCQCETVKHNFYTFNGRFNAGIFDSYETPFSNVLEKRIVTQLVKIFQAFYKTQRVTTAFTTAIHLSLSHITLNQSIPSTLLI